VCAFVGIFSFVDLEMDVEIRPRAVRFAAAFLRTEEALSVGIVSLFVLLAIARVVEDFAAEWMGAHVLLFFLGLLV
jgi:hypothetical protein